MARLSRKKTRAKFASARKATANRRSSNSSGGSSSGGSSSTPKLNDAQRAKIVQIATQNAANRGSGGATPSGGGSGGGSSVPVFGDNSQGVRDLQKQLNSQGANLAVDGIFGPLTRDAQNQFGGSRGSNNSGGTPSPFSDFNAPTGQTDLDRQIELLNRQFEQLNEAPNRSQIRREMNRSIQGELDALGRVEERQRQIARQDSQADIGSTRALANRSGTIGGSFGQQSLGNDRAEGAQNQAAIGDQFFARNQAIRREAMRMADAQFQNDFNNFNTNANNITQNAAIQEERRMNAITTLSDSFVSQGVDPEAIDPVILAKLASEVGAKSQDIVDAVGRARQARLDNAERFDLRSGQSEYRINPETGEAELLASRPDKVTGKSSGGKASSVTSSIVDENTPYSELLNIAKLTKQVETTKFASAEFDRQLNEASQSKELLKLFITKRVANTLPTADAQAKFLERTKIINQIDFISNELTDYRLGEDLSDPRDDQETSLLKGTLEKFSNRIGETDDPELAALNVEISFAVELLARMQTGAAITREEEATFRGLMPSTSNNGKLNDVITKSIRGALQRSIDSDIRSVIGKTGFELFNEEEETEEAATTEVDSTNFDFSTIANRVSQEEGIPIDKDITTLSDDELFNF